MSAAPARHILLLAAALLRGGWSSATNWRKVLPILPPQSTAPQLPETRSAEALTGTNSFTIDRVRAASGRSRTCGSRPTKRA